MKHTAVPITLALLLGLATAAHAKKGGGGGGPPPNTTPLDILYTVPDGGGYGMLYAIQDDGSGNVPLAATRGDAAWSPDGTQVTFYGVENGFGVYAMDVDGGTPQKLVAIDNLLAGGLDWCPGKKGSGAFRTPL